MRISVIGLVLFLVSLGLVASGCINGDSPYEGSVKTYTMDDVSLKTVKEDPVASIDAVDIDPEHRGVTRVYLKLKLNKNLVSKIATLGGQFRVTIEPSNPSIKIVGIDVNGGDVVDSVKAGGEYSSITVEADPGATYLLLMVDLQTAEGDTLKKSSVKGVVEILAVRTKSPIGSGAYVVTTHYS